MERLTLEQAIEHAKEVSKQKYTEGMLCHANPDDGLLDGYIECGKQHEQLATWLEKLKTYEDAEKNGLLFKFQCKIGDDVYQIPSKVNYDLNILSKHPENNRIYHQKVARIVIEAGHWYVECDKDREYGTGRICIDSFFKETWFLSKEEAEATLAKIKRKDVTT